MQDKKNTGLLNQTYANSKSQVDLQQSYLIEKSRPMSMVFKDSMNNIMGKGNDVVNTFIENEGSESGTKQKNRLPTSVSGQRKTILDTTDRPSDREADENNLSFE